MPEQPKKDIQRLLAVAGKPQDPLKADRFLRLVEAFGAIGRDANGGVTRLAFSSEDIAAREKVIEILKDELGLTVRIDGWGNIFGRREGSRPDYPVFLTGSHLDSVRNGGRFDGPAGVFCGMETLRALAILDIQTRHSLEVVVFTAEEPNEFGLSTIGSRGVTGALTHADLVGRKDALGTTLVDALRRIGGDPDRFEASILQTGQVAAFLEVHIEQMPYLEKAGKDIGIVEGITGIKRMRIGIRGRADHAGTTPMDQRQDALSAAAEMIANVRRLADAAGNRAVASVGRIHIEPNAVNVVPGLANLEVDVRSFYPEETLKIVTGVQKISRAIERKYNVRINIEDAIYHTKPIRFSKNICGIIADASNLCHYPTLSSISMAGHDAYHMARVAETAMIFVPSAGGASHCPQEWTEPEALVKASRVLATTWLLLDQTCVIR